MKEQDSYIKSLKIKDGDNFTGIVNKQLKKINCFIDWEKEKGWSYSDYNNIDVKSGFERKSDIWVESKKEEVEKLFESIFYKEDTKKYEDWLKIKEIFKEAIREDAVVQIFFQTPIISYALAFKDFSLIKFFFDNDFSIPADTKLRDFIILNTDFTKKEFKLVFEIMESWSSDYFRCNHTSNSFINDLFIEKINKNKNYNLFDNNEFGELIVEKVKDANFVEKFFKKRYSILFSSDGISSLKALNENQKDNLKNEFFLFLNLFKENKIEPLAIKNELIKCTNWLFDLEKLKDKKTKSEEYSNRLEAMDLIYDLTTKDAFFKEVVNPNLKILKVKKTYEDQLFFEKNEKSIFFQISKNSLLFFKTYKNCKIFTDSNSFLNKSNFIIYSISEEYVNKTRKFKKDVLSNNEVADIVEKNKETIKPLTVEDMYAFKKLNSGKNIDSNFDIFCFFIPLTFSQEKISNHLKNKEIKNFLLSFYSEIADKKNEESSRKLLDFFQKIGFDFFYRDSEFPGYKDYDNFKEIIKPYFEKSRLLYEVSRSVNNPKDIEMKNEKKDKKSLRF